jgi:predicted aldo/keto reductase-like oxidoreductase
MKLKKGMMKNRAMGRRKFLKASALGVFGAGIPFKSKFVSSKDFHAESPPKIREFRMLGRTGFKVSDISCGICEDASLLNAVLDAGVNYIDTAESYENERIIAQAIQNRDRQSLFITTKLIIEKDVGKQGFIERTKKCLERLKTDYIDCMMIHSCSELETLKTEGFHAAMTELKAQGRLRFLGVSNHGVSRRTEPKVPMEKVLLAAAEDGRFDIFLMAYNFLNENNGAKVLQVCKEKNIGATLMKVNPVGLYLRFKEEVEYLEKEGRNISKGLLASLNRLKGRSDEIQPFVKKYNLENQSDVRTASVKWALTNDNVGTVCCRFENFDHLDEFVSISGKKLAAMDIQRLGAYKKGYSYTYCRHACGSCEPGCPENVPVNTIMRYNHYFVAQGREKEAMLEYAALAAPKADRCRQCPGHCEKACPYGVPIQGLLALADNRLTLA